MQDLQADSITSYLVCGTLRCQLVLAFSEYWDLWETYFSKADHFGVAELVLTLMSHTYL